MEKLIQDQIRHDKTTQYKTNPINTRQDKLNQNKTTISYKTKQCNNIQHKTTQYKTTQWYAIQCKIRWAKQDKTTQ